MEILAFGFNSRANFTRSTMSRSSIGSPRPVRQTSSMAGMPRASSRMRKKRAAEMLPLGRSMVGYGQKWQAALQTEIVSICSCTEGWYPRSRLEGNALQVLGQIRRLRVHVPARLVAQADLLLLAVLEAVREVVLRERADLGGVLRLATRADVLDGVVAAAGDAGLPAAVGVAPLDVGVLGLTCVLHCHRCPPGLRRSVPRREAPERFRPGATPRTTCPG